MIDALSRLRTALAGRYRVEREIGAGGMATVYLAHDERHDRQVAVKVLRPELAAAVGAERFLREIKVTASLQHPHILPLFDSGEVRSDRAPGDSDEPGLVYYVMPFVEGESLRARLDRLKQLPLREALAVARAVASALDHAHHRGILHRDIKPENILLAGDARDGVSGMQALVADFGVALAVQSAGSGRLTDSGLSVGTPTYMSPEQASAERNLGPASDVYALGAVLYEMLSGEPPFTGPTAQAVVARALKDVPMPLRVRRDTVPLRVESAVMRALAKSPADRQASAAQFADELETDQYAVAVGATAATAVRGRAATYLPWALVGVIAMVAGALLVRDRTGDRGIAAGGPGVAATHFAIAMPEGASARDWRLGVATSPDGGTIAFVAANAQGRDQIYLKRLDEPNVNALAGSTDGKLPFFSPDGRSLAFFAPGDQLKAIALASGSVTLLADSVGYGSPARWMSDGCILYGNRGHGIECISENGPRRSLTRVDTSRGEQIQFAPQILPGTRALMYSVQGVDSSRIFFRVMVRPDSDSAARVLIEGAGLAEYLGNGQLAYQKEGELFVASFNIASLTVSDDRRVLSGLPPMNRIEYGAPWSVSRDMLVYGSTAGLALDLVWVDRAGGRRPLPVAPRPFFGLTLSPDGRRVIIAANDRSGFDLWVYDLAQDVLTQLSRDGRSVGAIWGPTAELITAIEAGKILTVVTRRADGGGTPVALLSTGKFLWPAAWTRDGRSLVLMDAGDITALELPDRTTRRPVVETPAVELGGRLSPDERWLAYFSDATGRFELYVTPFPGGGPKWRVSHGGAREAVWSRNGRELFYRSENGRQLLSVDVALGAAFVAGTPVVLFEGDFFQGGGVGQVNYDVSPDGKRFLMLERAGTESGHLNVVLGWEQLARRAPAR